MDRPLPRRDPDRPEDLLPAEGDDDDPEPEPALADIPRPGGSLTVTAAGDAAARPQVVQ
jgi:hypothetical protein